jgi:hypothetical protein
VRRGGVWDREWRIDRVEKEGGAEREIRDSRGGGECCLCRVGEKRDIKRVCESRSM